MNMESTDTMAFASYAVQSGEDSCVIGFAADFLVMEPVNNHQIFIRNDEIEDFIKLLKKRVAEARIEGNLNRLK